MRTQRGKLITVWVPGNHGAGGSTIADGMGIAMQYFTGKKVLIANFSGNWSYMERFLENDVEIKYSMDYLKSFGGAVEQEHIHTFATPINDDLYIIPGTRIQGEMNQRDKQFEVNLLEKCLKSFDVVIADIATRVQEENLAFLDRADLILAVTTPNEIMLDDIYESLSKRTIRKYMQDIRTTMIFNMMPEDWDVDKELARMQSRYDMHSVYGMIFDGTVLKACCIKRKFYSYLRNELGKENSPFPAQIEEVCKMAAEKLHIDIVDRSKNGKGLLGKLFR